MSTDIVRRPGRLAARSETIRQQLPLLGKIKCGLKAKKKRPDGSEVEFPQSVDYFIASGKYADAFSKVYPDKPSKIEVIFFSDNPVDCCYERLVARDGAGNLVGESDGVAGRAWDLKADDYRFFSEGLSEERLLELATEITRAQGYNGKPTVRTQLTMQFILPKLPGVFGMWQLNTYATKSTIPQVLSTFDNVRETTRSIRGIPFDLLVHKHTSNNPSKQKRNYPVITLVPNISQENMELVGNWVATGQQLRGVLTPERIKAMTVTVKLAEAEPERPKPEPPLAPAGQLPLLGGGAMTAADYEAAIDGAADRESLLLIEREMTETYGGVASIPPVLLTYLRARLKAVGSGR